MKKIYHWFIIKEWLLLPFSIYEALTCKKPYKVYAMMQQVPKQNKIWPFHIVMKVLEWRF